MVYWYIHFNKVKAATNSQASIDAKQRSLDFTAWSHYLGASSSWASAPVTNAIDQSRLIYTRIPNGGDAALMPLLLSKHVIGHDASSCANSCMDVVGFEIFSLILLVLILSMFLIPRNGKRSTRNIDAHYSLMGKSQPRRYGMKEEHELVAHPKTLQDLPDLLLQKNHRA